MYLETDFGVKNIIPIFLISLIFLQSFSKLLTYVRFKLNQDYIAQNLCVQRTVKNNKCNGNCQLEAEFEKTDLADDDSKSEPSTPPSSHKSEVHFIFIITDLCIFKFLNAFNTDFKWNYHCHKSSLHLLQVFHPPK